MDARNRFAVNDRVLVKIRRLGPHGSPQVVEKRGTVRGFSVDGALVRVQLDGYKTVTVHDPSRLEL